MFLYRHALANGREAAFRWPFVDTAMLEAQPRLAVLHQQHLPEAVPGAELLDQWENAGWSVAPQASLEFGLAIGIFTLEQRQAERRQRRRHRAWVGPFKNNRILGHGRDNRVEFGGICDLP